MNKLLIALVFLLVAGFTLFGPVDDAYAGDVYYVATTGNDSTGDGSIGNPWKTLEFSVDQIEAGHTLYARSGTFTLAAQVTPANSGASGNYITISAYPGETVGVDASALTLNNGQGAIHITTNYVRVTGFNVANCHGSAGNAGGAIYSKGAVAGRLNHNRIDNNYVYNCGGAGIQAWYTDYITIDHNEANDCTDQYDQECISLINCTEFDIGYNYVYNVPYSYLYYCTEYGPKECIDAKVGCHDGVIHHNHTEGGRNAIYVDGYGQDTYNIDIYNNHVEKGFVDAGIKIGAESAGNTEDVYNFHIYNNVIHDGSFNDAHGCFTQAGIILTGDVGTFDLMYIYNNIVYNVSSDAFMIDGNANPDYTRLYIYNNVFWSVDATRGASCYDEGAAEYSASDHHWGYNVLGADGTDGGCGYYGSNNLTVEPTWVTGGSGCSAEDLSYQDSSNTVDAANSSYVPSTDYSDTTRPRPAGGAYDIGAFEYLDAEDPPPVYVVSGSLPATIDGRPVSSVTIDGRPGSSISKLY